MSHKNHTEIDLDLVERLANSRDRRVFYIDVGDLSPEKATDYLNALQTEVRLRSTKGSEPARLEAFRNESDNEFTDISSERSRTYNFGSKGFVKINQPLYLSVSPSGGHRLFSADGQSHYVPSGWIHISWVAHDDQPHFVK